MKLGNQSKLTINFTDNNFDLPQFDTVLWDKNVIPTNNVIDFDDYSILILQDFSRLKFLILFYPIYLGNKLNLL